MFNYIELAQNISLQKVALFQYQISIIFKYNIDIILKLLFCVHNKIATSVDFVMI